MLAYWRSVVLRAALDSWKLVTGLETWQQLLLVGAPIAIAALIYLWIGGRAAMTQEYLKGTVIVGAAYFVVALMVFAFNLLRTPLVLQEELRATVRAQALTDIERPEARFALPESEIVIMDAGAGRLGVPYRALFRFRNVGAASALGFRVRFVIFRQALDQPPVTVPLAFPNEIPPQQDYPVWINLPGIGRDEPGRYFVVLVAFPDALGRTVSQPPFYKKWDGSRGGLFLRGITDMTEEERDALLARFPEVTAVVAAH